MQNVNTANEEVNMHKMKMCAEYRENALIRMNTTEADFSWNHIHKYIQYLIDLCGNGYNKTSSGYLEIHFNGGNHHKEDDPGIGITIGAYDLTGNRNHDVGWFYTEEEAKKYTLRLS